MGDSLAALVLAAGAGARLAPLTRVLPKPLCPVAGVALVDHALARVEPVASRVAVNVHHGREPMLAHLDGRTAAAGRRVHAAVEDEEGLGTAGAIGHLRPWLDGEDVLVVNGDTWCPGDISPIVQDWDRERVRVVVLGEPGPARLEPRSRIVASLLPWSVARELVAEPTGLYEVCWAPRAEEGRLDIVGWDGPFVDCATPRDYLEANLAATGGRGHVDPGARVEGDVVRSVVWPGTTVAAGERLVEAIRASDAVTVVVR